MLDQSHWVCCCFHTTTRTKRREVQKGMSILTERTSISYDGAITWCCWWEALAVQWKKGDVCGFCFSRIFRLHVVCISSSAYCQIECWVWCETIPTPSSEFSCLRNEGFCSIIVFLWGIFLPLVPQGGWSGQYQSILKCSSGQLFSRDMESIY